MALIHVANTTHADTDSFRVQSTSPGSTVARGGHVKDFLTVTEEEAVMKRKRLSI